MPAPILDPWTQRKMAGLRRATRGLGDEPTLGPRPATAPPWAMVVGWGSVVAIAAGIFWFTAKGAPVPMRANRRRRRSTRRRRSRRTSRRRVSRNSTDRGRYDVWNPAHERASLKERLKQAQYNVRAYQKEVDAGGRAWARELSHWKAEVRDLKKKIRSLRSMRRNPKIVSGVKAYAAANPKKRRTSRGGRDPQVDREIKALAGLKMTGRTADYSELVRLLRKKYGVYYTSGLEVHATQEAMRLKPNRRYKALSAASRKRMPPSSFALPGKRFPVKGPPGSSRERDKWQALQAIRYLRMGRVKRRADYLAIRSAIIRLYGANFWRSCGGPSWPKVEKAKRKRRGTRRGTKRRTSRRLAANRR